MPDLFQQEQSDLITLADTDEIVVPFKHPEMMHFFAAVEFYDVDGEPVALTSSHVGAFKVQVLSATLKTQYQSINGGEVDLSVAGNREVNWNGSTTSVKVTGLTALDGQGDAKQAKLVVTGSR